MVEIISCPQQSLPHDVPVLASNNANPHATFIHYNQVTPVKDSPSTKKVRFQCDQQSTNTTKLDNNLFSFFQDSTNSKVHPNSENDSDSLSDSELSAHTLDPSPEDILKSQLPNTPKNEDYTDVL